MQQSEYLSVFFVCQKPMLADDDEYSNGNDKSNDLNGHHWVLHGMQIKLNF